jgi:hypothetical protein
VPQERIPIKVCPGPAAVATLALRGEEAVWDMHSELMLGRGRTKATS